MRASYSNFFETPYNENLLLSSATGAGVWRVTYSEHLARSPCNRAHVNQYNVGLQQGFGKHVLVDGGYFWKFTHNAYDFDTLFNSPITFPIRVAAQQDRWRLSSYYLTPIYGFSAYAILGHTRARFFGPESGGILFNSPLDTSVFASITMRRSKPPRICGIKKEKTDPGQVSPGVMTAAKLQAQCRRWPTLSRFQETSRHPLDFIAA